MNKFYLIAILSIVTIFSGCNKSELLDMPKNNEIGFSSFIDKITRATDTDITNLSAIEVYGWRGNVQIFDAQAVTVDATGNGTYSPLQYWEPNYTYAFEAISPKSGDKGVLFAPAKDGGTITFESDSQTDLLYSKAADKTTESSITTSPGKVDFTFAHLLSRVKFTFLNTFPENAVAKISVEDVKITNAYKNGTISPFPTTNTWVATNNNLEVDFNSDAVSNLVAGTGQAQTEHKYLIPVASPSYMVTFTVVLNQNGAISEYEHSATITASMEKGKSYNFIASINENTVTPDPLFPIEFTATVDEWGSFGDTNIVFE